MNKEWKEVTFGDLVENKSRRFEFNDKHEVVFINTGDVLEGKFLHNDYISKEGLPGQAKKKVIKDDILFSEIRPANGRYALIDFDACDFVVSTKFMVLHRVSNEVDLKFLYILITSSLTLKKMQLIAESRSGTFPQITFDVVSHLPFNLPPLPEQKAIAHILGTLDDKIELNRKMNETLEAMAQAMFRSWFVDFDPVMDNALAQGHEIPEALTAKAERRKALIASGKYQALPKDILALFPASFVYNEALGKWIPEGWNNAKLESQVEVKYGKDHKKLNEGVFPCYGSGGIMRHVEHALCDSESVLIPRKGSLNNMMYVRKPFWSVDTMFYTLFKNQNMVKFLFYYLKKFNFAEMNVGSAVPSMTTKVLNNIDLILPNEIILENFEQQIERFISRKESNIEQSKVLVTVRDVLLSQLISGKTRLPASFIQQFETPT